MDRTGLSKVQPNLQVKDLDVEADSPAVITSKTRRMELEPLPDGEITNISEGLEQNETTSEEIVKKKIRLTIPKLPAELELPTLEEASAEFTSVVVPSYATWFSFQEIGQIERQSFPDYFSEKNILKDPAFYKECRDFMVRTYRQNPSEVLTVTACRRYLNGNVADIFRIHSFLEKWGLINFQSELEVRSTASSQVKGAGARVVAEIPKEVGSFNGQIPGTSTLSKATAVSETEGSLDRASLESIVRSLNTNSSDLALSPCPSCSQVLGKSFFHSTKDPKLNICKECFARGKFPSSSASNDFMKFDSKDAAEIYWTDQETMLLLEAIEQHSQEEDWNRIADHVGTKSPEQCVLQFLQLPIQDYLLEESFIKRATDPSNPSSLVNLPRIPFSHTENPVMMTMAFLASTVHPCVASAASKAALAELEKMEAADCSVNDRLDEVASVALASAAVKASTLARLEERKLTRLLQLIVEAQLKKVDLKLAELESTERSLENEKKEIEKQKMQIVADRVALKKKIAEISERLKASFADGSAGMNVEMVKVKVEASPESREGRPVLSSLVLAKQQGIMTLPYEIVRAVLVTEILAFIGLIAPFPPKWRRSAIHWLHQSEIFHKIKYGLTIIFVLVAILFFDSVSRSIKLTMQHENTDNIKDAHLDTQIHAKMFYAQRNMYLTGFTLFLALVLNRFAHLLMASIKLEEQVEVVKKQASQQGGEYYRLMEQLDERDQKMASMESKMEEYAKKVKDAEVSLKQSKNQHDEYMRLADKYNELEKKLRLAESNKDK